MNCPKCHTSELRKRSYNSPLVCSKCGGMWLMEGGGARLGAIEVEEVIDPDTDHHDKKTGLCPSGHGIMIRAKVDIDEPFYLEKCTACGGIWFDRGEWVKIAELNLAVDLQHIWTKSWQRRQSKQKGREQFLNLNQKLLGEKIFAAVMDLAKELKAHPEKHRALALLQQEIAEPPQK
jgi:Zn-finger nucleic acid-binding protein